jgi:proliferating cell nuclear antigen PCNA
MPPRKTKANPAGAAPVSEDKPGEGEAVVISNPTPVKRKRAPKSSAAAAATATASAAPKSDTVSMATFTNIKVITGVFRLFAETVGDGNMKFTQEGISMSGMDASHVSLVRAFFGRDTMMYRPSTSTQVAGVPFKVLYKILSAFQNALTVTLKLGAVRDKMVIAIDTETGGLNEFQMALMNIEVDELEIPENLEYAAEIKIPTSNLKEYINQVEKLEVDAFTIKNTGTEVRMTYSNTHLTGDVCLLPSCETASTPVSVMISTKYGKLFYSSGNFGEISIMKLGHGIPMVFNVPLETMATGEPSPESFVEIFIAPKINDDDVDTEDPSADGNDNDNGDDENENIRY